MRTPYNVILKGIIKMSLFDGSLEVSNEMMVNENNWSMIKSGFHEELTNTIKYIVETETPRSFYRDKENQKKITDVIKKYTGINVVISAEYKCFAMMPPDLNKNHTLIDSIFRQYYDNKELKKQKGTIEAFVDIKNFKIGGAFKDVKVELFLDPAMMWDTTGVYRVALTPAEVSAVILHEVGHMFSYFALAAHTYSINLPMLGTLNRIANTPDTEKVEIILKEWNDSDNTLTKVDVKELAGKDKQVIVTALVSNQVKDTKTLMKQREYEEVNAEHLADKFAVRCGAGAEITTALNKMFVVYGTRQTRGTIGYLFNEFIAGFTLFMCTGWVVGAVATFNPITTPIMLMLGGLGIFKVLVQNTNTGGGTYDTDIDRFGRMRNDMVSMLKDKEIDKAVGKRIREGIATIDKVVSKYKENKSIIGMLGDMVIGPHRRLLSQAEFYRELEKLSANNLFVAAYDLRNLK